MLERIQLESSAWIGLESSKLDRFSNFYIEKSNLTEIFRFQKKISNFRTFELDMKLSNFSMFQTTFSH